MRLRTFALLCLFSLSAEANEPDCSMCHDSSPLKDDHVPVDEVSIRYCTQCHEENRDDPFVQALHRHTNFGMECSSCHDDGRTSFDEAAVGAESGTE